jgi:transcription elongation GreA/GreB family factor
MGSIKTDVFTIQTISLQSPIGKALINKKRGDRFEFNGKLYSILNVD